MQTHESAHLPLQSDLLQQREANTLFSIQAVQIYPPKTSYVLLYLFCAVEPLMPVGFQVQRP